MNKEILNEIALQAGGSHYPAVGGETLEKFAELLLDKVIEVVQNVPLHCACTTHDMGIVECTIGKSVEAIEKTFDIPHNYKRQYENSISVRPASRISRY